MRGSRPGVASPCVLAIATAALCAAVPGAAHAEPPVTACIGMGLSEAYERFGVPDSVFVHRGAEQWQDDVVFYFDEHLYLFWYSDRLWQIRFDHRHEGTFLGLRMGDGRDEVIAALGVPYEEVDGSLVFFLPDSSLGEAASRGGFALRLRAFFLGGRLHDAYVYRGDF